MFGRNSDSNNSNNNWGAYIGKLLSELSVTPAAGLAIMMLIPFVLGMFIDGAAITMILIPVFMPIVRSLGLDPVWFCMLFNINLLIGFLTPPFGMCLFYMKGVAPKDVSMAEVYRAGIPFVPIMVVGLVLAIVFPQLVLYLPNLMQR